MSRGEDSGDDAIFTWPFPRKMPFYLTIELESLIMCCSKEVLL